MNRVLYKTGLLSCDSGINFDVAFCCFVVYAVPTDINKWYQHQDIPIIFQ